MSIWFKWVNVVIFIPLVADTKTFQQYKIKVNLSGLLFLKIFQGQTSEAMENYPIQIRGKNLHCNTSKGGYTEVENICFYSRQNFIPLLKLIQTIPQIRGHYVSEHTTFFNQGVLKQVSVPGSLKLFHSYNNKHF